MLGRGLLDGRLHAHASSARVGSEGISYYGERDGDCQTRQGRTSNDALPSLPLYNNSDGSEPEMCGNGIRCLARFISDVDKASPRRYKIHTLAGE